VIAQANPEPAAAPQRGVAFADLVWAHWRVQREHADSPARLGREEELAALRRMFSAEHGAILSAYWSRALPEAAALTAQRTRRLAGFGLLSRRVRYDLHRELDWVHGGYTGVQLLHRCDGLAIRANETLGSTAARIATSLVFSIVEHVLGVRERMHATSKDTAASETTAQVLAQLEPRVEEVERYIEKAARVNAARIYSVAMLVALALVAIAAAVLNAAAGSGALADAAAVAVVAGATGAAVSVLTRMSGRVFAPPTDVGAGPLVVLGMLRVAIGAVFGAAAYFLIQTALLITDFNRSIALYASIGFFAGFLERFVRAVVEASADLRVLETERAVKEAVEESVRTSLRGPELAKWRGFVAITVAPPGGGARTSESEDALPSLRAGEAAELRVAFAPTETGSPFERLIDIREGIDARTVTFKVRASSDTIDLSEDRRVEVPVGGSLSSAFVFTAPSRVGTHRLWVRVAQRNRIVQVVPVDVSVGD
jgi:hypothetical protein